MQAIELKILNAADNVYLALKKIAPSKVAEMQLGMKETNS